MVFRALAIAASVPALVVHGEDHWAVLVAGSNTFSNYRHQADVCHAYHVLTSRGFHPDNIITMMYDDVAPSQMNPFPGKLFNYPWKTLEEAVDVYDGCKIDYREKDVSPDKFLAVLMGDAQKAGGKVLQSKADDHVFINFVDHGGVGLIAFPEEQPVLHAKILIQTLQAMHTKGMFKQLTFYLETCESGSMFQGLLPKKLPVYALTAANAKESSWGTFCGAQAKVAGKDILSCLGDLFSVNWMMDSDKTKASNETMAQQYSRVKAATKQSHVMRFGQVHHVGSEAVSDFQGPDSGMQVPSSVQPLSHASAVDSRDVRLDYLYHAFLRDGTPEAGDRLRQEIEARQAVKELGKSIVTSVPVRFEEQPATDDISWTEELLDCHEQATTAFGVACGWNEGRLPLSRTLYNLCVRTSGRVDVVAAAVREVCASKEEIVV